MLTHAARAASKQLNKLNCQTLSGPLPHVHGLYYARLSCWIVCAFVDLQPTLTDNARLENFFENA